VTISGQVAATLGEDRYSGERRIERYPDLARDIVNTHPDLVLAVGGLLSLQFKKATTTIPLVTLVIDPIGLGLVASTESVKASSARQTSHAVSRVLFHYGRTS
jgi:ABC-type uncharacterized transport system substrate-binding protein